MRPPKAPRRFLPAAAILAFLLGPSLLLLLPARASAQEAGMEAPGDSAAFELKRKKILESSPDERMALVLEAAEDLARDGFYAEALELVFDLEDTTSSEDDLDRLLADDSAALPEPPFPAKPAPAIQDLRSYVRSSFEYDDWDGSGDFGGEVRAKLEWLPPRGSFLERISPTFSGSDQRTFFDLAARGSAFGRMLKADLEGLVEKKLWQTYGDSSDRLFLQGMVEGSTRPLGKPVSVSLPLRAEIEQYRHERPYGLPSSRYLSLAPALEAVSWDLRRNATLSWNLRRFDYPSGSEAGRTGHGPFLLASWYGDRFAVEGEGSCAWDAYDRDTSLLDRREIELRGQGHVRPVKRLKAGLSALHRQETGDYRDSLYVRVPVNVDTLRFWDLDTVDARYDLSGSTLTLEPSLAWEWNAEQALTFSVAYTRAWYPLLGEVDGRELDVSRYLTESYEEWHPELAYTILSRRLFLNLSAGYQMNAPYASEQYPSAPLYSEGFTLGGDCNWKFSPWLEVDLSGEWRHQVKGGSMSRVSDILNLSVGLTSRFE